MKKRLSGALLFAAAFQMMVGLAEAASCGNTGEGFEAWKSNFEFRRRSPDQWHEPEGNFGADRHELFIGHHRG